MSPGLLHGDKVIVNKIYPDTSRQREIKRGDIIIFNYPFPHHRNKIEFKSDYFYCKRIIGLPGDTIIICNGNYIKPSLSYEFPYLSKKFEKRIFYHDTTKNWSMLNFGPMQIPATGQTIIIDSLNFKLYSHIIEYETKQSVIFSKDTIHYRFKEDYYFVAGDNVSESYDSRYFGPIPGKYITGSVIGIIYSKDPVSNKYRRNRFFKSIRK